MHLDTADVSSTDPIPGDDAPDTGVDAPGLRVFVFVLFFVFGGITSLNDVLIPKLKELFTLSYAHAMLVQSAFFLAYLLISIPAAQIVRRIGYMRTAAVGVMTMAAGCLSVCPGISSRAVQHISRCAAQHDGAGSAGGRETCRLLLGWGIGGSVYRRLSSGRIVARQDACGVRWRIHCTDTGVDEYGRRSVRMVAAGDWTL